MSRQDQSWEGTAAEWMGVADSVAGGLRGVKLTTWPELDLCTPPRIGYHGFDVRLHGRPLLFFVQGHSWGWTRGRHQPAGGSFDPRLFNHPSNRPEFTSATTQLLRSEWPGVLVWVLPEEGEPKCHLVKYAGRR